MNIPIYKLLNSNPTNEAYFESYNYFTHFFLHGPIYWLADNQPVHRPQENS